MERRLSTNEHGVSQARLDELQNYYDESVIDLAQTFYPDAVNTHTHTDSDRQYLTHILESESASKFNFDPSRKTLFMLQGPRASGKSVIQNIMINKLGFNKVINTTTRPRRAGEQDGRDYYFIDDMAYEGLVANDAFVHKCERPGRGSYGITADEVIRRMSADGNGALIEEEPKYLIQLLKSEALSELSDVNKVLLYTFPPNPAIATLYQRLQKRQNEESDPAKRVITEEIFNNNINEGQFENFLQMKELVNYPEIQPLFLVSEDPESTEQKLRKLFKKET